jgi:hypothetical protein
MMWEYELTDQEYRAIVDALEYAEEAAIGSEATAKFREARKTMMQEHASKRDRKERENDNE